MSSILFKQLFAVFAASGVTIGGVYAYRTNKFSKDDDEAITSKLISKIDIFLSSENAKLELLNNIDKKTKLHCKFDDKSIWNEEFECNVFSYSGTDAKNIELEKFDTQFRFVESTSSLDKYYKTTIYKEIWDAWTTETNKDKKITIFNNEHSMKLSLLLGFDGEHIIKTNQEKTSESISINDTTFAIGEIEEE